MKKSIAFSAIAMFVFVFSSCKKDYTCTCTLPGGSTTTTQIENVTKDDAESACNALIVTTLATSCTL